MSFVLASMSATRRAMLDAAGIPHDAMASGLDEEAAKAALATENLKPRDVADALAEMKAMRAATRVDLRWTGRARLFIDGADAGEHDGGYTHAASADPHTYRIEVGASRCGFLYANLD